ncbi:MAG: N-acetyltransferase [Labilithrix sp.]|nr:N-acetyltransferase [Labilithrix sp.]MCW5814752.1 N-acetyltransferase [Labilithrix sp.]
MTERAAGVFVHPSSYVDEPSTLGAGTTIWFFCHVSKNVHLGESCNLGQNVFVGEDVRIGNNVKIQNNVSVYPGVTIEDDVFLGPSCVFTNVSNPRSAVARRHLYESTLVRRGATIGANATIVCGVTIGRHAFVAAGAVVTKSVADYAMMSGVPARRVGWMSRHGHKLQAGADGVMVCPESGLRYRLEGDRLRCLDVDDDSPLPTELRKGIKRYREYG